jgi:hypothetical protein
MTALTDSAALVLSQLKTKNSDNYWKLLNYMFDRKRVRMRLGFSCMTEHFLRSDGRSQLCRLNNTSGVIRSIRLFCQWWVASSFLVKCQR